MGVKRAHMVSRGYLRPWADKKGRVDVIDLEKNLRITTAIQNATVVSYAYETEVLTYDLEEKFERIETRGIPAILKLRISQALTAEEKSDVVAFLDMHLDRGRYADQTKVRSRAVVVKADGSAEEAKLNLADRFMLSQYMKGVIRLTDHDLEGWPWQVYDAQNLVTGDGAVVLWGKADGNKLATVTFPLSPTRLLVIGNEFNNSVRFNTPVVTNSKRWIVGSVHTLNRDRAEVLSGLLRGQIILPLGPQAE